MQVRSPLVTHNIGDVSTGCARIEPVVYSYHLYPKLRVRMCTAMSTERHTRERKRGEHLKWIQYMPGRIRNRTSEAMTLSPTRPTSSSPSWTECMSNWQGSHVHKAKRKKYNSEISHRCGLQILHTYVKCPAHASNTNANTDTDLLIRNLDVPWPPRSRKKYDAGDACISYEAPSCGSMKPCACDKHRRIDRTPMIVSIKCKLCFWILCDQFPRQIANSIKLLPREWRRKGGTEWTEK